jgi:hypothetical protein
MEGSVARKLGPARRLESFNASLEARKAVIVADEMLQWQQQNYLTVSIKW